jgi:osmotically inducible protein OsmC
MQKSGSAKWQGGMKDGIGAISTQSGVLKDAPYGFKARFEGGPGTNPEELIGAAHAGCFTMALSMILGQANMVAQSIETKATVTLEQDAGGYSITAVHLDVAATIPGAEQSAFDQCTAAAKAGCPVSKLLKAPITMNATLTT